MRARPALAVIPLLLLTACSSPAPEPTPTSAIEAKPATYTLEVAITDTVPIDFTLHSDDGTCWVHLAENTPPPDLIVEDADGTIVATKPIETSGDWGTECTLTTQLMEVPASGIYMVRLEGTVNHRSPKQIEFETTVQAEPVDGSVFVEWTL